jgi:hypothetical protein
MSTNPSSNHPGFLLRQKGVEFAISGDVMLQPRQEHEGKPVGYQATIAPCSI